MSENRIAPSKPKRRIGWSVTSAAASLIVDQLEEPALLGPQRAIFGKIAPGLAHQPDRRDSLPRAAQRREQGLDRRAWTAQALLSISIRILELRVVGGMLAAWKPGLSALRPILPTA